MLYIAQSTYDELLQYDFGVSFNASFAGTKIGKLDDFLKLCATTGIRPIFSIHNATPTTEYCESLYNIVNKWGLIPKLVLKISTATYQIWHNVFGDIWMYDFVVANAQQVTAAITAIKEFPEYGKARFMIDVPVNVISRAIAESITSENIICGLYDLQHTLFSVYKRWIDYGVTQFTDDNYPLTGLMWHD